MNLKNKPISIKFNLSWVLLLTFVLIVLAEAYFGYKNIYANLFNTPVQVPEGSVVRVNLKSYESTIQYLEGLYEYEPEDLNLPRTNPFD